MALGERVREARTRLGLTQGELGERIGMTQAAIHALEKRDSQTTKKLYELSSVLGVSPEYLLTGKQKNVTNIDDAPDTSSEVEWLGRMDAWDAQTPLGKDEVELPLFREVELAAGGGRTQVIENHGPKLRFSRAALRDAGVDEANAGCAKIKGNSMERLIPDGTTIGVDKGSTNIKDGDIYAIDHEGMLRVKYLYRLPGGGLKLASENEAEHPPETYNAKQVQEMIRVIGRVFWWSVLR
ncbi:helix-turn-helix transcriptional regulator [Marinobacter alexandrii]|uniref:XRE family transcriptional regulator n=1 Tax=Marinobacter alexandrii TaxID=2570351 RepID=UPI001FFE93EE|nr:helix-turn-helix transcriptional regulator [Marinobacter alexandrii]MCK2149487.1 helix-turn-helix transcriptional regulator [Marinobacter alexandrii]